MLLLFGSKFRTYNGFDLVSYNGIHIGGDNGVFIQYLGLMVIISAVALMVALLALVRWTQLGRAMRAVSFDREAAAMMGIDPDRVIAGTFFIGSALAGAAGVMFGLLYSQIYHLMGFLAGLKGFTAAVVGGIGSIPGAMLGGLLVGLVESWAKGYLNGNVSDLVVFGILIGIMLVRPSGLLGHAGAAEGLDTMSTRPDPPNPGAPPEPRGADRRRPVGLPGRRHAGSSIPACAAGSCTLADSAAGGEAGAAHAGDRGPVPPASAKGTSSTTGSSS